MNNPASRLVEILRKMSPYRSNGNQAIGVWASILGVEKENYPLIIAKLAKIYELPYQTKTEIEKIPGIKHEVYLRWMPKVLEAIRSSSWNGGINQFATHIDEIVIHGLDICADQLSSRSDEKLLPESEVAGISNDIHDLCEKLLASALDPELKNFTVSRLSEIEIALRDYRISGTKPIERAVHAVIGSLALNREISEKLAATDEGQSFWKAVTRVALILNLAWTTIQIADKSYQVLQSTPVIEVVENESTKARD